MHSRPSLALQLQFFAFVQLGLIVVVGVVSLMTINALNDISHNLQQTSLQEIALVSEVADSLTEFRLTELNYLHATDDSIRRHYAQVLSDRQMLLLGMMLEVGRIPFSDKVEPLRDAWSLLQIQNQLMLDAVESGDTHKAGELFNGPLLGAFLAADQRADALTDAVKIEAEAFVASSQDSTDAFVIFLLAIVIAALGVGLGVAILVRFRIAVPLRRVTDSISSLAAGHLDADVAEYERSDEIGAIARSVEVFRQNALELQNAHAATQVAQERAQELARHDPLTGLPNRRLFAEQLDAAVLTTERTGVQSAVLLLDLDYFKPVNDAYGHGVGDRVLCAVAQRLADVMEGVGSVARLGGDEFAIIVGLEHGIDAAVFVADNVRAVVSAPIFVDDLCIQVGGTVGIAVCPTDGVDAQSLLRAADLAMYRAKGEQRGTSRFFESDMNAEVLARSILQGELHRAIAKGEIRPYYQPIVALKDNRLVGFEILARWVHPTLGILAPTEFIAIAEERGLIGELTEMLLKQACHDLKAWPPHLTMSLNISPTQLRSRQLPQKILAILSTAGIAPGRLEIEITESALVKDVGLAKEILTSFKNLGIQIALDDFGTGYSSFYHLCELQFDKIKIDKSFVSDTSHVTELVKIVRAVVALGKSLSLKTTAEGIETREQMDWLAELGCEFGQGYYFGQPVSAEATSQLLQADGIASNRIAALPAALPKPLGEAPGGSRIAASGTGK